MSDPDITGVFQFQAVKQMFNFFYSNQQIQNVQMSTQFAVKMKM